MKQPIGHYVFKLKSVKRKSKSMDITSLIGMEDYIDDRFVCAFIMIIEGTGAGQFRFIKSNTKNMDITHYSWEVRPDETSLIKIHWNLL